MSALRSFSIVHSGLAIKPKSWCRLAALLLTTWLAAAVPAQAEKRVALVIGNASYQSVGRLENPLNDARLIANTLRKLGFTLVGNGPLLDLDEPGLRRAVQNFGRALPGADVALFFYAGHGVQVRGNNYLVPIDANPVSEADLDFQMLDTNVILRQMENAGTRLNLVMLDACRNNPIAGRGLRSASAGLAQVQAPDGTFISFATQPGSVAQDGTDGNSPYTKALAQAMQKPGIGIFDTFNDVGLSVASATGGTQRPWFSSSPIRGSFFFAGPQQIPVASPLPQQAPQVAVVAPPLAPQLPPSTQASPAVGTFPGGERTVELRFSHWVPTQHPMHAAALAWAAAIGKASNETIKVAVYPSQQLGKAFEHYNMARDGIVDVAHVNPGYEPGRFPIVSAVELPFIFTNAKEGSAAIDAWYRRYADREMKDVRFCLMFAHDPGTFHFVRKKVVLPSDMSGMKFRPANAVIASWMRSLGVTNVQSSAPEIRDILEKGAADGVSSPWGSMGLFGIDKVTRYHIDAPIYLSAQVWVLNKAKYDGLSAAQKRVMDDHCASNWALRIATPWADFESSGKAKIAAQPGRSIYALTPNQLAAWRKSAEPVIATWESAVSKAGHDAKAVLDDLKKTAAQHRSAY
jgi:TRAP-type C4-dicarboxylate transport system substrate-binding protein